MGFLLWQLTEFDTNNPKFSFEFLPQVFLSIFLGRTIDSLNYRWVLSAYGFQMRSCDRFAKGRHLNLKPFKGIVGRGPLFEISSFVEKRKRNKWNGNKMLLNFKMGKEIREEWSCRWQVKFVLRTYIAVVLKSVRFNNILLSPGDQLSACQKEYQKNLRRQSASRYVPRCAADGSYGEVQCTGGLCYCVTPRGEQIHGTKTFNSARKPNCSHPGILKP